MMNFQIFALCGLVLCGHTFAQEKTAQAFASFLDLPSRSVIGGFAEGKWLDSEKAGKRLSAPFTDYRLYTLKAEGERVSATKASPDQELCPDVWMQAITKELGLEEKMIGVNAPWNPMLRKAKSEDTTKKTYLDAVRNLLISKGIDRPKVKITQLLRVDLDGDGQDEVLISATNYKNEAEMISAVAGDYSFVAMRRVVDGKVRTQFVVGEVYPKSNMNGAMNSYEIGCLLDLNGDGVLEVIIRSAYYEGGGTEVWQLNKDRLVHVLGVECGA